MNNIEKFIVDEESNAINERIDKALTLFKNELTRSNVTHMIEDELITVNGQLVKPSYKLKLNDEIIVLNKESDDSKIEPQDIPLDIVYEDNDLLVINKKQGMVVHPSNGHNSDTLVNACLYHCKDLSGINGVKRPGIVHRIDKDTSGLIVVCKNDFTHQGIAEQLATHSMYREYYALVKGVIHEDDCRIIAPIGRDPSDRMKMAVNTKDGKSATTHVHVLERFKNYTLISCRLETGRTHQIRVHLTYIGHPLEGDLVYGSRKNNLYDKGQLLHAYKITFVHPRTNKEMTFETPIPSYFESVLEELRNENK